MSAPVKRRPPRPYLTPEWWEGLLQKRIEQGEQCTSWHGLSGRWAWQHMLPAERESAVVDLLAAGWTHLEIGKRFGLDANPVAMSHGSIGDIVYRLRASIPAVRSA